jgi:hypothetical protein
LTPERAAQIGSLIGRGIVVALQTTTSVTAATILVESGATLSTSVIGGTIVGLFCVHVIAALERKLVAAMAAR